MDFIKILIKMTLILITNKKCDFFLYKYKYKISSKIIIILIYLYIKCKIWHNFIFLKLNFFILLILINDKF
jgi:hypothetical protein